MQNIKTYRLELNGISPEDLKSIQNLIEENSHLFESTVLSAFNGDARYTYISDLFEVTDIADSYFEYEAQYQYFEGCKDKNFSDFRKDCIDYEIVDGFLIFDLDETEWEVN